MVILRLVLNALPAKQRELMQTVMSMVSEMRTDACCAQANVCVDLEDENRVLMLSHWKSREGLDAYVQSDKFGALLGSGFLLSSPLSAFIDTVAIREGLEAIKKLRSRSKAE